MTSLDFFLISGAFLIACLAALALFSRPAAPPPPPKGPQRWKTFKITPARLSTGAGPAVEELPNGAQLATIEKGESWTPRLHLVDQNEAVRIAFKPAFFALRTTLRVWIDRRLSFSLRLTKDRQSVEILPAPEGLPGPGGQPWQLSGNLRQHEWELRVKGRTVAAAEAGSSSSGNQDAPSSTAHYYLDILQHEDPLPVLGLATASEVLLRLNN
ncbi:MAG: hypothetical protein HY717_23555 [Planctomycetes bacterium]|nr:hypothetical protein [Planctomycetota bacterium]